MGVHILRYTGTTCPFPVAVARTSPGLPEGSRCSRLDPVVPPKVQEGAVTAQQEVVIPVESEVPVEERVVASKGKVLLKGKVVRPRKKAVVPTPKEVVPLNEKPVSTEENSVPIKSQVEPQRKTIVSPRGREVPSVSDSCCVSQQSQVKITTDQSEAESPTYDPESPRYQPTFPATPEVNASVEHDVVGGVLATHTQVPELGSPPKEMTSRMPPSSSTHQPVSHVQSVPIYRPTPIYSLTNIVNARSVVLSSATGERLTEPKKRSGLKDRALELIRTGVMPLLPPARREWNQDRVITFSNGSNEVVWPPKGWKQMSPAKRLLSRRYAAMKLVEDESGFPALPEDILLDSFNMLALPGTAPHKALSPAEKSTWYLYEQLRQIITTGRGDANTIELLEAAASRRTKQTDCFVNVIERHGIPVRINRRK